jgi:phosphoglycolate phosphatase
MIKLIIFDLDGTLIDSSQDIANAINHAILGTGLPDVSNEETIKLIGEGITRLIEKLLEPDLLAKSDEVLKKFMNYYSSHLVENTRLYPFVKETLQGLKDFRKVVLSNKRASFSTEILEKLGVSEYFDAVLGSDTVEEKKPSPKPVNSLLDEFSVSRDKAIIVGDSDIDIKTGRAAGIRSIGVTYGYRSKEILHEADLLIDDLRQLEHVINEML